jgi:Fe-S-cluster formation regulator IscX/YfhJ
MRTEGWTDMTKLIVAFRNFEKEPKKSEAVFGVVKFETVK